MHSLFSEDTDIQPITLSERMASRAEVFRLKVFESHPSTCSPLASLPLVTPRFSLPSLDDGNASDRMLAGLRGSLRSKSLKKEETTWKGKEKEDIVVEDIQVEGISLDDGDSWLHAAESEPGPSKRKLNRVCLSLGEDQKED